MEVVKLIREKAGEQALARLRFARSDKSVNVLDVVCMQQLEAHIDALEKDAPDILVLESTMPGCFIAGADLDVIAAVSDVEEAQRLAERGQSLCRRIEDLSSTSIAVVNGSCMGGGLEIALACDHIVGVYGDKTLLALPEIKIGIHPGFGGCVRLPKRVGWIKAVEMIMSGSGVDARKARRLGLAAISCHPEQIDEAIGFLAKKGKAKHVAKPFWMRIWPLKRLFFAMVQKRVLARFKHLDIEQAYPAIPAVLKLLSEIVGMADGQAYALEAESLGRMAVTPTCKNLIRVFRLGESLKKQQAVQDGKKAADEIEHAAVFGAGVMGGGIAWVAAKSCEVDMHDISEAALGQGMKHVSRFARRDPRRMQRIRPALSPGRLKKVQVVIEAVLETMQVKQALWKEVEEKVGKDALLLTNTSSLSVSEMQKHAKHPERMAGMHFFNPAPKMPLVEVIAGGKTSASSVNTTAALCVRWGKFPVIVSDSPGFLVNRCLMPYMVSAFKLVEAGQKPEHVDGALKNFGMPMGAIELADRVGLDICQHVGEHLNKAFGKAFVMPGWFAEIVDAGLLGEKSGSGFYKYEKGKRVAINSKLGEHLQVTHPAEPMTDQEVVDACLLPMLVEALKCLNEKVVDTPEHLDAAMIYGIGFPPFHGGLLRYFSGRDKKELVAALGTYGLKAPSNIEVLYE